MIIKKTALLTLSLLGIAQADQVQPFEPTGSTPMLSVEESLKRTHLPEGYSLELVVSEPHVKEPSVVAFDGNGRMFVAEMRTYMQDADGTGEDEPRSRVSWHEDTNGDGQMDKHGVFVDNLLLPRIILPLDDRVLIQETYTNDIYSYRDTNGDGTADEKKLWHEGGKRGGNMEHQPTGLIWSMDNGLYTTYNGYRMKYNHDGPPTIERTGNGGGQWGLTQDDYGKPWFVHGGGETGPLNFQTPILYGGFSHPQEFPPGFREVFPLVGLPDVQGGSKRYRPEEKNLNHFTSTCGQTIVRGSQYPAEFKGNLLFAEPVGRLIRRSPVAVKDGITFLKNAHDKSEFIRSTDPNFRPVNMCNAPDGCTYIVDMHRGIIQQGSWTAKGSYLRGVIEAHGLQKNIGRGRIYRLVHKDHPRSKAKPNMLNDSPSQLVAHLENPNGWWRDTAQKLLILKNDPSVVPALESMARNSSSQLARIHALWTIEGLGKLDPALVRSFITDANPIVRRAGLRISESLVKLGDKSFTADIQTAFTDSDPEVASQALLTANFLKLPKHQEMIKEVIATAKSAGVKAIAEQIITGKKQAPPKLEKAQLTQYLHGEEIHQSLCAACHGADANGVEIDANGSKILLAPSLVDNPRLKGHPEVSIKTLLHGMEGPIDGVTYSGNMISMASHGEEWIADILSYLRYKHNDQASFITPAQVKEVKARTAGRTKAWTQEELIASSPKQLQNKDQWVVTANENPKDAKLAIDGKTDTRYTTGKVMKKGMWFQIELPAETNLSGCHIDTEKSPRDYPRGYKIEHSLDGKKWELLTKGKGKSSTIQITHNPTNIKFLKITQTGKGGPYWSIHEIDLLQTQ